jgi:nicotinamide mononucleotide (NMN) deamidase PncC
VPDPLNPAAVPSAASGVVHALAERKETLATVESLTGGLIAATVVEVAGASAVFRGGLVVYATDLKATLAGVPREMLDERWTPSRSASSTWRWPAQAVQPCANSRWTAGAQRSAPKP